MGNMYTEFQAMADELLQEFGQFRSVVFASETPVDENEVNPDPPIRTEYEVKAVVVPKYIDSVETGTMILSNQRTVTMSMFQTNGKILPVEPKTGDKLVFDDYEWTIPGAVAISPGGVPIVFKMEVSR